MDSIGFNNFVYTCVWQQKQKACKIEHQPNIKILFKIVITL